MTKNPATDIHRPFAKAVTARLMTKIGKTDEMKTTRDSAAIRSRKSHITQVKKAVAVGRKFESQYAMQENTSEIRTRSSISKT